MGLFSSNFGEIAEMAKTSVGKPRNYALESGVYRFGRSKMYHKKAVYKFAKKKAPKKAVAKKPVFVKKEIGGKDNGGFRMVRVKKLATDYPTLDLPKKGTSKNLFSKHKRTLRKTLTPGTVAIVLAGVHKGKRVIVLKQLASGLLLVTGPYAVNGCPLRRVNQCYLIATQTKVDVSGVKIADNINDDYFKHAPKNKKDQSGDVFESKSTKEYEVSEQKKTDQKAVDAMVVAAINKHPEGASLKQYLRKPFGLSRGQYPHQMEF